MEFIQLKYTSCAVLQQIVYQLLITEKTGTMIGCIHAGWKGLKSRIIENFFENLIL